jgi:hypothetical protein
VRGDGQRLFGGALPTLIQWDSPHPCDSLAASGVALRSLAAVHPRTRQLQSAYAAIGLSHVEVVEGEPDLLATVSTPRGIVTLSQR